MQKINVIDSFAGEYRFLSNFYPCTVFSEGFVFSSVEAAYQAAKSDNVVYKRNMSHMKPGDAKRYGRQAELKNNWNFIKRDIMRDLLLQKFSMNEELGQKLLATGNAELVEGNTWNDTYWGVCNGVGENNLGKLLMDIREILPKYQKEFKIIGLNFKVEYCSACATYFVRCPKCGNNCCNGGYGLGGKCDVCPLCYEIQGTIDKFLYA